MNTPTEVNSERESLIEKIKLAVHLAAEAMVFQGDTYPVKAIPYTSFLHILDGFRRTEVPEPSAALACPHWAEGKVTMRKGCTACEAEGRVPEPSRQIRECAVCGEKVTMSNATEAWEKRHEHTEPQGEPNEHTSMCDAWADMNGSGCTCHVEQGEPSDAQVKAAMKEASRRSLMWRTSADVRAVLRAAAEAR